MNQSDKLYGLEGQEQLDTELDALIDRLVDDGNEKWPVDVLVFRRMDVTRHAERLAYRALEDMLETLDEEHSDPEGNPTEPTEAMKAAALAFAKAVTNDYVAWACEPTGEVIKVEKPEES